MMTNEQPAFPAGKVFGTPSQVKLWLEPTIRSATTLDNQDIVSKRDLLVSYCMLQPAYGAGSTDTARVFSCTPLNIVFCRLCPLPAHVLPWSRSSQLPRLCFMRGLYDAGSRRQFVACNFAGKAAPVRMAAGHSELRTAMQVVQRVVLCTGRRMCVAGQGRRQRSGLNVTTYTPA
jgi:hypothetical protein